MSTNNLWEVTCLKDMVELMEQGEFVLLTLVLQDTPKKERILLRKSIKQKAAVLPTCQFVYYIVKETEFGQIMPLLEPDKQLYPRMFFIKNKNMLYGINQITTQQQVSDFMAKVDEAYAKIEFFKQQQKQAKEREEEQFKLQKKLSHLVKKGNEYKMKFIEELKHRKEMEEHVDSDSDDDDSQDVVKVR